MELLNSKLRYHFRDVLIVDDQTKPHHVRSENVNDIFKMYRNTLVIYKDVDCFYHSDMQENYAIVITYGHERRCSNLESLQVLKLMTSNDTVNFDIAVSQINRPIVRRYTDDFETTLRNNPDYREMALNFINANNRKVIFDDTKNLGIFTKIVENLEMDITFGKTVVQNCDRNYVLHTDDPKQILKNVDEVHFLRHFNVGYVINLLKCTQYTKLYPRMLKIYIYATPQTLEEVKRFVLQLDRLKNLMEFVYDTEIHLVNNELVV